MVTCHCCSNDREYAVLAAEDRVHNKKNTISVHYVNKHRAFENVNKFVKTIATSIQKIMAGDHISSLYD